MTIGGAKDASILSTTDHEEAAVVTLTEEEYEALRAVAATGISRTRDALYEERLTPRGERVLVKRLEDARSALSKLCEFQAG